MAKEGGGQGSGGLSRPPRPSHPTESHAVDEQLKRTWVANLGHAPSALQVPPVKDQGEPDGQSKRKTPLPTEAAASQTRPKGRQEEFASEPNEVRLLHSPKNSRWGCPRATGCRAGQTVKSVSPHLCLVWEAMTVGQRVPTPALMLWVPLRGAVLLGALGAVGLQAHAMRQRLSWGLQQQVHFYSRAGNTEKFTCSFCLSIWDNE